MKKEVIAFDIGGTYLRCGLVRNNKIIEKQVIPTPKTKKAFLNAMESWIKKHNNPYVKGVGIGIAGSVKNNKLIAAPNLVIKRLDFEKYFRPKFRKAFKVKNDAGCFALAELKLGVKRENFILITIGTGIGGGMVVNGKIYDGTGYGVEFGHILVNGKDFESLWKKTKRKLEKKFGKDCLISTLKKKKDPEFERIMDEMADYVEKGIVTLIDAIGPEVVVLGGGVRESGNYLLKKIRLAVKQHAYYPKQPKIQWTKVADAGILGASLLIE